MKLEIVINGSKFLLISKPDLAYIDQIRPKYESEEYGFYAVSTQQLLKKILDEASNVRTVEILFNVKSHIIDQPEYSFDSAEYELDLENIDPRIKVRRLTLIKNSNFLLKTQIGLFDPKSQTIWPRSIEWLLTLLLPKEYLPSAIINYKKSKPPTHWRLLIFKKIKNITKNQEYFQIQELYKRSSKKRLYPDYKSRVKNFEPVLSFQIKLTSRCNLNCDFCYYPKKNLDADPNSVMNWIKIIEKLKETDETKIGLLFHGGEPLLYPYLIGISSKIKKEISSTQIHQFLTTNGLKLSNQILLKIKEIHPLAVSFNEKGRFSPKTYLKFVKALKNLNEQNQKRIIFLSLHTLTDADILFREYQKLLEHIKWKKIIFTAERLIVEDIEQNLQTHEAFLFQVKKMIELTKNQSQIIYIPKIDFNGSFMAPGCGSCFKPYPIVIDIDGSVRFCSKNYSFKSKGSINELNPQIEPSILRKKFYEFSAIEEYWRRHWICQNILKCKFSSDCHHGCLNFPLFDESGICAQLKIKAI